MTQVEKISSLLRLTLSATRPLKGRATRAVMEKSPEITPAAATEAPRPTAYLVMVGFTI